MAYYIDILSPDTYESFSNSDKRTTGFKEGQKGLHVIKPGDKLICYITKLSRWVGVLEVTSQIFVDSNPIFTESSDPFINRFNVNPQVWLTLEKAVPIISDVCWEHLTFTKKLEKGASGWTIMVRSSLRKLDDGDGLYLENLLASQTTNNSIFPLNDADEKKLKTPKVRTKESKEVRVSIPESEPITMSNDSVTSTPRDSFRIQGMLSEIGERMNLKIWLPRSDRQRVLEIWQPKTQCLLDQLPLNYDDATLKTIENIDVLWIRGRSIVRAFEVEHTTSIYSGILRMADLMALQPNLNIKAHIVAPDERKEKVLQEISRPVFSLLESGPLSESCTFISYQSIEELSAEKKLEYMNDAVLEEFAEYAEI